MKYVNFVRIKHGEVTQASASFLAEFGLHVQERTLHDTLIEPCKYTEHRVELSLPDIQRLAEHYTVTMTGTGFILEVGYFE